MASLSWPFSNSCCAFTEPHSRGSRR